MVFVLLEGTAECVSLPEFFWIPLALHQVFPFSFARVFAKNQTFLSVMFFLESLGVRASPERKLVRAFEHDH
jgi:hypothetical protein